MTTLALAPTSAPGLSAAAERLLDLLRAETARWVVLRDSSRLAATGFNERELAEAIGELESAELVERAPYGPLLHLR